MRGRDAVGIAFLVVGSSVIIGTHARTVAEIILIGVGAGMIGLATYFLLGSVHD